MRRLIHFLILVLITTSCESQTKNAKTNALVGGPCEGCEAVYEYGNKKLTTTDTLPDFRINEPKLKLTGTIFKNNGKTPAENIILYIYQTNRKGIYPTKGNEKGWAKRHGYIRGWIKTDQSGQYTFYTFRPASYPNSTVPEHIHVTIKEPDKNEYYIDDFVFDDDQFLTEKQRNGLTNRGGSGLVNPILEDNILTVHRDIILGLNIPNYE
ncbi:hypothetical protein [Algibacter luteus]|uniref:Protocatechuate 3,4-dioxygenase beta subunit n=1 Tax=Algibacter luteus TaxID=1178825 RepID=A0A1M6A0X6_9FLAO|nr:hypothetical protein [Algibacter luteus]SHI30056.1 protocatechuate 3,4-dioxygenase beta subunit [Algibacter luteus]